MFVGMEMSHAAPQTRVQQKQGVPLEPTVVGLAYTVGHPLRMQGTYWYQEPRVTRVADPEQLGAQFLEAVKNYLKVTGQYPHHIVLYRSGVSEGDFQTLLISEMEPIEESFKKMAQEERGFKPPRLTIIVVQQESNYRVVPRRVQAGARAPEQNVSPGTCVDKEVMHPTLTEFLLVPHKAIQGTAKPSRCTVVWDSSTPRLTLEELENLTYTHCYGHGIVLSPVSVPAPLYAGAELAKRGSNNWKVRKDEAEQRQEGEEHQHGQLRGPNFYLPEGQEPQHFFLNMSRQMAPRIQTKFWA